MQKFFLLLVVVLLVAAAFSGPPTSPNPNPDPSPVVATKAFALFTYDVDSWNSHGRLITGFTSTAADYEKTIQCRYQPMKQRPNKSWGSTRDESPPLRHTAVR